MSCETERGEKTTATAVRLKCIAEEVFENTQRYSEAITRIMKIAKVKERQAESLFSEIHKAGLDPKNLIKLWELNQMTTATRNFTAKPPQLRHTTAIPQSAYVYIGGCDCGSACSNCGRRALR